MIIKGSIFGRHFGFSYYKSGKKDIYGYTNRCDDGKFIVFLDYDDIPLSWIKKEIVYMQEDFNLGTFYILQSSENSFHCVCFSKVKREELINILRNSSVDDNYYLIPNTIGRKLLTLRLTNKRGMKPIFLEKIERKSNILESYEHKKFFHRWFNIIDDGDVNRNNDLKHKSIIQFSNYKVKE